jgi:formamidopyrimidine-DNA glycosylase
MENREVIFRKGCRMETREADLTLDDVKSRVDTVSAVIDAKVRALCEELGYGAVIQSATEQWEAKQLAATLRDPGDACDQCGALLEGKSYHYREGTKRVDLCMNCMNKGRRGR